MVQFNPFAEHAAAEIENLQTLAPGGATLTMFGVTFPCTHTHIQSDWAMSFGKSVRTMVEQCEFIANAVPAIVPNSNPPAPIILEKGTKCQLTINPGGQVLNMQLWIGGLLPGGLVQRWMLVDANYKG